MEFATYSRKIYKFYDFLQKSLFSLTVLHLRCVVYADDHLWTMTVETHPISSRLKSSFLCTSFIRDLRIFGHRKRGGHVEKGVHQATQSTGRNEGWNLEVTISSFESSWLDVSCGSFKNHIYFHIQPFVNIFPQIPVRFTEGETPSKSCPNWCSSEVPSTTPPKKKEEENHLSIFLEYTVDMKHVFMKHDFLNGIKTKTAWKTRLSTTNSQWISLSMLRSTRHCATPRYPIRRSK